MNQILQVARLIAGASSGDDGLQTEPISKKTISLQSFLLSKRNKWLNMGTWTVFLDSGKLEVTAEQLCQFRDFYIRDSELACRISQLFLLDMYVSDFEFGISPEEVLFSVNELENGETATGAKQATMFKHAPLRGLWHKHFFAARFLVQNITLGLGKDGLRKIVEEVCDPKKSDVITKEMTEEVARRISNDPLEARDSAGKLAGEWIVFVKNGGQNYYLCIVSHDTPDKNTFDRIVEFGVKDFPELHGWIESAAKFYISGSGR